MRYAITVTGETSRPALVQNVADMLALALGGSPQVDVDITNDPPPRATGRVDFAVEPVAVTINLTDAGAMISVSARDGEVAAAGATVDAAMATIGKMPQPVPAPPPASDVPAAAVADEAKP